MAWTMLMSVTVLTTPRADTISSTEMFGQSRIECGNYKNLSLEAAKVECKRYLDILNSKVNDFEYK